MKGAGPGEESGVRGRSAGERRELSVSDLGAAESRGENKAVGRLEESDKEQKAMAG